MVRHPRAARFVFGSEQMDGAVLGLFLFATFVGAVVAGLAGFAMSLARPANITGMTLDASPEAYAKQP